MMRFFLSVLAVFVLGCATATPTAPKWTLQQTENYLPETSTSQEVAIAWLLTQQAGNIQRAQAFSAGQFMRPIVEPTVLSEHRVQEISSSLDPEPFVEVEGEGQAGAERKKYFLRLIQGGMRIGVEAECSLTDNGWKVTQYHVRNAIGRAKSQELLDMEQSVLDNPASFTAWKNYAKILSEEGDPYEVVIAYQRAFLLSDPGDNVLQSELLGELGLAYDLAGEGQKAEMVLSHAIELSPKEIKPYLRLGAVLAQANRAEEAITLYEMALDRAGEHPEFLEDMAFAYIRLGKKRQAVQSLEYAIRLRKAAGESEENSRWLEYDAQAIKAIEEGFE